MHTFRIDKCTKSNTSVDLSSWLNMRFLIYIYLFFSLEIWHISFRLSAGNHTLFRQLNTNGNGFLPHIISCFIRNVNMYFKRNATEKRLWMQRVDCGNWEPLQMGARFTETSSFIAAVLFRWVTRRPIKHLIRHLLANLLFFDFFDIFWVKNRCI